MSEPSTEGVPFPKEAPGGESLPRAEVFERGRGRYGAQNLAVSAAQVAGWAAILGLLDRLPAGLLGWALRVPLVLLFCLLMQGVFSMMHEYMHKNAHRDPRLNYVIGLVGSTLFGTSATLHRVHHWGHHVRNRSEAERGEFIHPGERRWQKVALYYFAVLGGLWIGGLVFPLIALFIPYSAVRSLARTKRFNTYAAAHEQFRPEDWTAMRAEGLLLYAFWGALVGFGLVGVETLALAYGAFALSWSSLQWAYHLRTPIHVVEGAYNLRAPWLVRVLFLNFNYNLTHHRHPGLPWQELPASTDLRETQPLWYRWALMAKPPTPIPDDLSYLEKTYF